MGNQNRGIGQYEAQLIPHLLPGLVDAGARVRLIVSKDCPELGIPDCIEVMHLPVVRDVTLFRIFAEQAVIPFLSRGASIFLSLESVFPFPHLPVLRRMVVVHDIHILRHISDPARYPEEYSWRYRNWAGKAALKAIRNSDRIVTVSEFTKREVHDVCDIPLDRIVAIPNGLDHARFRIPEPDAVDRVRHRYRLPESFDLYIGPFSRKKNLRLIVEAHAAHSGRLDVLRPVVVAGDTRRSDLYQDLKEMIRRNRLQDRFLFLGFVDNEDIPALYAAARAFIYPSLYEGFGLPPLEAMACGAPVVAAGTSSLPEVTAGAAELIDPSNPESLFQALEMLSDPAYRSELVSRGLRRAREFTWKRTAAGLAEAILGCPLPGETP